MPRTYTRTFYARVYKPARMIYNIASLTDPSLAIKLTGQQLIVPATRYLAGDNAAKVADSALNIASFTASPVSWGLQQVAGYGADYMVAFLQENLQLEDPELKDALQIITTEVASSTASHAAPYLSNALAELVKRTPKVTSPLGVKKTEQFKSTKAAVQSNKRNVESKTAVNSEASTTNNSPPNPMPTTSSASNNNPSNPTSTPIENYQCPTFDSENFEQARQTVSTMDFTTQKNTAVFYSGPTDPAGPRNYQLAQTYAQDNGLSTIESTQGGFCLNQADQQLRNGYSAEQMDVLWGDASSSFAANAQGGITVFVHGASLERTFARIEAPIINANTNINSITECGLTLDNSIHCETQPSSAVSDIGNTMLHSFRSFIAKPEQIIADNPLANVALVSRMGVFN